MRIDLADLRLFLCVLEAGSITAGAARAHLALASASERLRRMEQDTGVRLLERRHRGVAATEAGEALAHHARLLLRQKALLDGELHDFAAGGRGTLHLYANSAALTEFLPSRLAPWLAQRPHLRVELKERPSADIVRAVAGGLVEAGIVSDAVDAAGLQRQAVAGSRLALLVPAGHRLAAGGPARLADALDEPFVGLAAGNALQQHVEERARAAGRPMAVRIRMSTYEGMCAMVAHGIGLGVLPQEAARRHRRGHAVRSLALADGWARRKLCLCFRDWNALSPTMRGLLLHLGAEAPEAPRRGRARRAPG